MQTWIDLIGAMLPVMVHSFDSLNVLALLARTHPELRDELYQSPQLYRHIADNMTIVNKRTAAECFVLNNLDLQFGGLPLTARDFPFWQRILFQFPRGHLLYPRHALEIAIHKYANLRGVCLASARRQRRRQKAELKRSAAVAVQALTRMQQARTDPEPVEDTATRWPLHLQE